MPGGAPGKLRAEDLDVGGPRTGVPNSWTATTAGSYASAGKISDGLSELSENEQFGLDASSDIDEQAPEERGGLFDFDDLPEFDDAPPKTDPGGKSGDPGGAAPGACQIPEHFASPVTRDVAGMQRHKIAILMNGSRGDIQPCVAFAQELQSRGHRVTLLTNYDFLGFCAAAGVKAVPVYASWHEIFSSVEGISTASIAGQNDLTPQAVQDSLEDVCNDEACSRAAKAWAKANPRAVQDPYEALAACEPSVVFYSLQSATQAYRYERNHGAAALAIYFTSFSGPYCSVFRPPRPSLFATSPAVDAGLPDDIYADYNHVTGPWVLQERIDEGVFADGAALGGLRRFLEAGERPVTIGWGSMRARGHPPILMLGVALRSLQKAGKRGVVIGGWAELHTLGQKLLDGGLTEIGPDHRELHEYALANVRFVSHAPHAWLYARSCCIVHHGGSGTTYAALRAGRPSVVTPFFGDQFQFSQRVGELQAGVGFLRPMPLIESSELAEAITKAEHMAPPPDLVAQLQKECGVQVAADITEKFLKRWVETRRFAGLTEWHRDLQNVRVSRCFAREKQLL